MTNLPLGLLDPHGETVSSLHSGTDLVLPAFCRVNQHMGDLYYSASPHLCHSCLSENIKSESKQASKERGREERRNKGGREGRKKGKKEGSKWPFI